MATDHSRFPPCSWEHMDRWLISRTPEGRRYIRCRKCEPNKPAHAIAAEAAVEPCPHDWRRAMDPETKWLGEKCIKCDLIREFPKETGNAT